MKVVILAGVEMSISVRQESLAVLSGESPD